ncbi:MAG: hypothetical protein V2A65_05230 [Candidatus Omnitrophota bacterium]
MIINLQDDQEIYAVAVNDLQNEAINRIGRKLSEDEMYTAKKCVECGLSSCIDITLRAAIDEAVRLNYQKSLPKRKNTGSKT